MGSENISYKKLLEENERLHEENRQLKSQLSDLEGEDNRHQLRLDLEKFKLLIEESSDPIFSFSREGRYLYVNKAFSIGVRKPQDAIIGKKIWDVFSKEEAAKRYSVLERAFETGDEQIIEVRVPRPDGDWFFITTVTPIVESDKEVNSVICISKNITPRKQAELKLQRSEESLRIANATKDRFFSIIAHDLRTPFNSILGFSDMLASGTEGMNPKEVIDLAKHIHSSGTAVFDLLGNLLEWSRSQSGTVKYVPSEIQIQQLLKEVFQVVEPCAQEKSIQVSFDLRLDDEIISDRNMLESVIRNLLTNAIKFTPRNGSVSVKAAKEGNDCLISICDNGQGMDSDTLTNLFDIGYRKSTPGTENEQGSGLGLILCKEFTEKLGGNISVKSEKEKGSCFEFTIPIERK